MDKAVLQSYNCIKIHTKETKVMAQNVKDSTDMIHGSIARSILLFSIPLLVGNFFQQLYNTVDAYVVGNYVNTSALAAVGASTPIVNMLVGFFTGLGSRCGGGDIPVFWRRPDGADAPGHPQFPGSYGNPERFVYSTGLKLYKAFAPRHRRTRRM